MLSGYLFLLTGSTGRLGSETAARLEELGAKVLPVIFRSNPREPKRSKWLAKTSPILIEKKADLKYLDFPDYIINFHWLVNRSLSFTDQIIYELDQALNSVSFFWEWVRDISCKRFVNISSIRLFSHLNSNPICADTDPKPVTPYGISKLAAEHFFDAYFANVNLPVTHLRLGSVSSYGEHPSQLLSSLIRSAFNNEHININSGHSINVLYIEEAVDLIINAALVSEKSKYIVAAPSIPIESIASKFEITSGRKLNANFINLSPGIRDPIFNSENDLLASDWIRHTSLESIINKMIQQKIDSSTNTTSIR